MKPNVGLVSYFEWVTSPRREYWKVTDQGTFQRYIICASILLYACMRTFRQIAGWRMQNIYVSLFVWGQTDFNEYKGHQTYPFYLTLYFHTVLILYECEILSVIAEGLLPKMVGNHASFSVVVPGWKTCMCSQLHFPLMSMCRTAPYPFVAPYFVT